MFSDRHNQSCKISTRSVPGVRSPRWLKIAISHAWRHHRYNSYALACYTVMGKICGLFSTHKIGKSFRFRDEAAPLTYTGTLPYGPPLGAPPLALLTPVIVRCHARFSKLKCFTSSMRRRRHTGLLKDYVTLVSVNTR